MQIVEIKKRSDEVISKGNHSNEIILLINSMLKILYVVVTVVLENIVKKELIKFWCYHHQKDFVAMVTVIKITTMIKDKKVERLGNSRTSKDRKYS